MSSTQDWVFLGGGGQTVHCWPLVRNARVEPETIIVASRLKMTYSVSYPLSVPSPLV